jgi:hypothetical protein
MANHCAGHWASLGDDKKLRYIDHAGAEAGLVLVHVSIFPGGSVWGNARKESCSLPL